MKPRWSIAAIAVVGSSASATAQGNVFANRYEVATVDSPHSGLHVETLRIFPSKGDLITITIPFHLTSVTFGPDGKSLYGIIAGSAKDQDQPGLSRIDFNPIRATLVPGTAGFKIRGYAISPRQDRLVISGTSPHVSGIRCGLFEILMANGNVREILTFDCHDQWSWDHLSLSPNGEQAVATVSRHLELIDIVHGRSKSLGNEFAMGAWSPDGNWIVVRESSSRGRDSIVLMAASDFSIHRALGRAVVSMPSWSPDSRYLLLWKEYLFRCGIYPDLEPPATLETLDIRTGKRTTIRSSRCQISNGPTGWLNGEIVR